MSIREAAAQLAAMIHPSDVSFRPLWYTTMGIDETNKRIIIYAKNLRHAKRFVDGVCLDGCFEGFSVTIKKMGDLHL